MNNVLARIYRSLSAALVVTLVSGMLLAAASGCSQREDPILQLSAEEALELGKAYLEDEKWYKARQHFSHAFDVAPNTRIGREGLLLAADSYFKDGDTEALIQAEAKYRDYLNRFPTSDEAAYVQFQIANCLADRIRRADRDQTPTEQALVAYQEVLRLYPTSDYAASARERMGQMRNRLAEHEYVVGDFYCRFRMPGACINRLEDILEDFPDYPDRPKVYLRLAEAYNKLRVKTKTVEFVERLLREYPDSEAADDARDIDVLEPLATFDTAEGGAAAAAAAEAAAGAEDAAAEAAAGTDADAEGASSEPDSTGDSSP